MPTISELVVKITGDSSGLKKSTAEAGKEMSGLGSKALDLSKIIGPAVLGAAFIAAGKAVADYIQDVAGAADVIDKTSIRTGIATDELQQLQYAAGQTGVAFSAIQSSVTIMTRSLETNEQVFKDLNIQVKNADGTFRATDEIFNDTIGVLSEMKDETQRNALALKLFGRGAAEMTPLLDQGAAGIETLKNRSKELGLIMSEDLIKAGVEFGDLTSDLGQATKALGYSFAQDLLPSLNKVVGGVVNLIREYVAAKKAAKDFDDYLKQGSTSSTDYESALEGANAELERLIKLREQTSRGTNLLSQFGSTSDIDKQIEAVKAAKRELDEVARGQAMNSRFAGEAAKAQAAQAEAAARVVAQLEAAAKTEAKYVDARAEVLDILEDEKTEYQKIQEQIERLQKTPWAKGQLEDDRLKAIEALRERQKELIEEEEQQQIESAEKIREVQADAYESYKQEYRDRVLAERIARGEAEEAAYSMSDAMANLKTSFLNLLGNEYLGFMRDIGASFYHFEDGFDTIGDGIKSLWKIITAKLPELLLQAGLYALPLNFPLGAGLIAASGLVAIGQEGGIFDKIGGFFSDVGSGIADFFGFANGTDFAPGGMTLVGEKGPELVQLPRGSSVSPAGETRDALRSGSSGNVFNFYSPEALDAGQAAAMFRRETRALAFEGVI
jgi:hypothetical protein